MPVIYENQLKSQLNQGDIKPVYLLFGEDGYLINHYESLIISKTCGKDNDFDLMRFERDVDLQAVYDSVNQFPMMGERKCVILSDYDFESAAKEDLDRLVALVSDPYEFSTLILRFDSIPVDPKRSQKSIILINSAAESGGVAVCLNHREENDIAAMLIRGAKKRGFSLDNTAAKYMVECCGSDINTLMRELDKLCFFVTNASITKADIDSVCTKSVDASVYEFAKKIVVCDTFSALTILNDLFYMRIAPMIILYSTASVFVDMVRVNAATKIHIEKQQIAEDFSYGNKTFVLDNARSNLKRISDKTLKLCMDEILSADKMLKSFSGDEKTVLEKMTVRLIYIIANGESID